MIKFHPTQALLKQYVQGDLPASVAVIVASHVEMCSDCQSSVALMSEQVASEAFELETDSNDFVPSEEIMSADMLSDQQDDQDLDMLAEIMDLPVDEQVVMAKCPAELDIAGEQITLPTAINSIAMAEWKGIGKISRARLNLDDDERRMSLLHIDKGGAVPAHTHKGFEITLLLQGSFSDEMGEYQRGDFIWLDGEHTHNPISEQGCVCLTVSSDALHFTQGVSQLFNPLCKLIY